MAKNRMEEKKLLINKILSRQETSTRDYIVDDYLFPNQWLMGGDSKCFSGANYSYWPVPNGCFFDESIDMGPGGFWEIYPQSLINWDTAIQEYGFGEHNPIIAVIDEGFDIEHQDLVNQLWTCPEDGNGGNCEPGTHGYSFWNNSSNPPFYKEEDHYAWHGTAVAGILAAENNGQGTVGVCPNCQLMILHSHPGSTTNMPEGGVTYINGVTQAIYFAVANGARVINLSDTWTLPEGSDDEVHEAIQHAVENNVLFVSSAGNNPVRISEQNQYGNYLHPAIWPEVFTAGGYQKNNGAYLYYHPGLESVTSGNTYGVEVNVSAPAMSTIIAPSTLLPDTVDDLIAGTSTLWNQPDKVRNLFNEEGNRLIECPGGFIDDSDPDFCYDYNIIEGNITENLYSNFGGTSASAAMVSGLAGLLLSHNPDLTRENLINIITTTSDDMTEYQTIPFDTEIPWQYPNGLPYHPYSTSVSPDEIPPKINVFNALYKLYNDPILGDINNDGVVNVQDVLMLMDLVLNTTGRLPAPSSGICIGENNEQCNSIPEEICQPEYAGTELSQDPPQWPSEWGCYWFVSEDDYTLYDINGDGFVDVMDVVTLMGIVSQNPQTTSSQQQQIEDGLNKLLRINPEPTEELNNYQWYVKLKDEPLVKTFNRVKSDNNKLQKIQKRKLELLSVLDSTETKIKNIISENKIILKTHKASTAFFLDGDISDFEIKEIENIENVERVTYAPPAQIVLDASISHIKADEVWSVIGPDGVNPITGEGIRVGVIDTGVDSTHVDLGGLGAPEKTYERESFIPITENLGISLDNLASVTKRQPLLSNRRLLLPLEYDMWAGNLPPGNPWFESGEYGFWNSFKFSIYDFDADSITSTHEIPDVGYFFGTKFNTFENDWFVWSDHGDLQHIHGVDSNISGCSNCDWIIHFRAYNMSTGLEFELLSSMSDVEYPIGSYNRSYCSVGDFWSDCGFQNNQVIDHQMPKISQDEADPNISYIAYGVNWVSDAQYGQEENCAEIGVPTRPGMTSIVVWTIHKIDGVIDFNVVWSNIEGEFSYNVTFELNGNSLLIAPSGTSNYDCNLKSNHSHRVGQVCSFFGPYETCGTSMHCADNGTDCCIDYGNAPHGRELIMVDLVTGEEEYIDIGERGELLSWDTENNRLLFTENWRYFEPLHECSGIVWWPHWEPYGYFVYDLNTDEKIFHHGPLYPDTSPWPPEEATSQVNSNFSLEQPVALEAITSSDGTGIVPRTLNVYGYPGDSLTIQEYGENDITPNEETLNSSIIWYSNTNYHSTQIFDNLIYLGNNYPLNFIMGGVYKWVYDLNTNNLAQLSLKGPDESEYPSGLTNAYMADGNIFCIFQDQNYVCHEIESVDDRYSPHLNLYAYQDSTLQEDVPYVLDELPSQELINDKVVGGYNFKDNNNNFMDDNGHGTHVASTIAGNPPNGILKGVAPDAKIYAYKVCNSSGQCTSSAITAAIEASMDPDNTGNFDNPLDVINISLGGAGDPESTYSKDYIDAAIEVGVTVVASAGNSGPAGNTNCWHPDYFDGVSHSICCPSCIEGVISVAASTSDGTSWWWDEENDPSVPGVDGIAGFSSRGPTWPTVCETEDDSCTYSPGTELNKPDITAPGVHICAARANFGPYAGSECIDDQHASISGTSMAGPHIAGAAALAKQMNPSLTPQEIKEALMSTSVDIGYDYWTQGAGRVDVNNLYQSIIGGDPSLIGCMDLEACNYNPDAVEEGYCIYPEYTCPEGSTLEGEILCDGSDCGDIMTCAYIENNFLETINLFSSYGITFMGECSSGISLKECTEEGMCIIHHLECYNILGQHLCNQIDYNNTGWISITDINNYFCSLSGDCLNHCLLGTIDECGVCNGPGYFQCWDGSDVCNLDECPCEPNIECWNGSMVCYDFNCPPDLAIPERIYCGDFECDLTYTGTPEDIGWIYDQTLVPAFSYPNLLKIQGDINQQYNSQAMIVRTAWDFPSYTYYVAYVSPGCEYTFQWKQTHDSYATGFTRSISIANQLIPVIDIGYDSTPNQLIRGEYFDSAGDQHYYTEEFNNGILYFMKGYGQENDCSNWNCSQDPESITFTPSESEIYIMAAAHWVFTGSNESTGLVLDNLSLQKVDPTCDNIVYGCIDPEAINYDPSATVDDGTCEYDIPGCTDTEACNYNIDATTDDGSCTYPTHECWDGSVVCDSSDCPLEPVYGCVDPIACNYDSSANTNDGSCSYPGDPGYDCDAFSLPCGESTDCSGSGCFALTTYYLDADGDGLGCPSESTEACEQPNGYVENSGEATPENCDCFYNNFDCADVCSDPSNEPNQVNDCGDCVEVGGNQWPNPGLPCNNGCSDYLEECWDGSAVCDLADCPDLPPDFGYCLDSSYAENYEDCLEYLTIDVPCCGIPTLMSLPLLRDLFLYLEDGESQHTLENTFGTQGPITSIIGEGVASTLLNGVWIGGDGLEELDLRDGYWIKQSSSATESVTITLYGERIYPNWLYTYYMNAGTQPTLISYPIPNEQPAAETLEGMESRITGIINGDGEALTWMEDLGWVGSISTFKPGMGYWIQPKSGAPRDFSWNQIMTPTSSTSTQITPFNYTLPSNWTDISINEIFDDLREQVNNQGLTKKPILINRKPKRRGEN